MITLNYLSVKDSAASPANTFYAQFSTDAGNNTGWNIYTAGVTQQLQASRYDNVNTFYDAEVVVGKVTLVAQRYDNVNTFYTHIIRSAYVNLPSGNTEYSRTANIQTETRVALNQRNARIPLIQKRQRHGY